MSRRCLPLLGQADRRTAGDTLPNHPSGALSQGRAGPQSGGELRGHPAAAHRPVPGVSSLRRWPGRDPLPPLWRRDLHPLRLLRYGLGELRPLHRRRGGHRGLLHQCGRLPQPHAAERGGAVLCLPDDRRALLRHHVDDAADPLHERRPAAGHLPCGRACQDRRRRCPPDSGPDGKVHGFRPRGGEPPAEILRR